MRILSITLESIYSFSSDAEEIRTQKREARADRAAKLASLGIVLISKHKDGFDDYEDSPNLSVTETQYVDIIQAGVRVSSVNSIAEAGAGVDVQGAIAHVEKLIGKIEKFAADTTNLQYNEKVEVYTPGMALMLCNRLMLLEDSCTDAVQAELDNGWLIVAACPQPNQRRPDFILGRYDPHHAEVCGGGNSALRGPQRS